jgi:hypothetical protein
MCVSPPYWVVWFLFRLWTGKNELPDRNETEAECVYIESSMNATAKNAICKDSLSLPCSSHNNFSAGFVDNQRK